MADIEFHTSGEWTAVYEDGKLVLVGDTYLSDEWLHRRAGVVEVSDDAFMRGQNSRDGVAETLEDVRAYRDERAARQARAQEMRDEAARLLAMADELG